VSASGKSTIAHAARRPANRKLSTRLPSSSTTWSFRVGDDHQRRFPPLLESHVDSHERRETRTTFYAHQIGDLRHVGIDGGVTERATAPA
jgi:hypothetical protein